MKKFLKVAGYALGGIVSLVLIAVAAVYGFSEARFRKTYAVTPAPVTVTSDSATIARGAHLVRSVGGCIECHGENLAGKMVIDDPAIGTLYGANLTRGKGGVGGVLKDADFVRAIRHGVAPDGRPLMVMPSPDYVHLSASDLAAIVAYVKSVPPVDQVNPAMRVGPVARALLLAGKMPILSAEEIDHAKPIPANVEPGVSVEYGRYLASVGCQGCHGANLAGGPIGGAPPDWPPAANLTPAGNLGKWTEADFARALRTGKRPDGSPLNDVMPWNRLTKNLSDDEISALWRYLTSLPPAKPGQPLQTASR